MPADSDLADTPATPEIPLGKPTLLNKEHLVAGFDCGKPPLNDFLIKHALQNQSGGGARTYVLTRGNRVIGYYSLAPASIAIEDAPPRVSKGQARYPIPVILMARFALDKTEQRKGLGKVLLRSAIRSALVGADAVGGRAFVVHAKDEEAASFYSRFNMTPSPSNTLTLFLLLKDARNSLQSPESQ